MDYCEELFRQASFLASLSYRSLPDPTQTMVQGTPVPVGRRILPTYLMYGIESQFHRWNDVIRRTIIRSAFDFTDASVWRGHDAGLAHVMAQCFRQDSSLPALIWTSPVWVRLTNWAVRSAVARNDKTLPVEHFETGLRGPMHVPVHLGPDIVQVPVRGPNILRLRYPERPRYFLRVPRRRGLSTSDGHVIDQAFEESLVLGHAAEERYLHQGLYSGNDDFHRRQHGISYLDFCTLTLARFHPRQLPAGPGSQHRPSLGSITLPALGARRRPGTGTAFWSPRGGFPRDAWVRFMRLTLAPEDDMKIAVPLGAERQFWRFLVEHEGMVNLLAQAFASRRIW